jgi:hypothetical protein
MEALTPQGWAVVAIVSGMGVFGALYILSSILRDATRRVELYRRVGELREEYAQQMRDLEARGFRTKSVQTAGVDIVEDGPRRKAA